MPISPFHWSIAPYSWNTPPFHWDDVSEGIVKVAGALSTGRVIDNLTQGSINPDTSAWTEFDPNNEITFSSDDLSATFTYTNGVSNRTFLSRAISVTDTKSYAIRFKVENKSGSFTRENVDIIGDLATSIEVDDIENGERAVVVTANATGTITFRLGFGIDGNETVGADAAFSITNMQIEELPSGQTVPSEFVNVDKSNRSTVGFVRDVNSTIGTPASGALLTESYSEGYNFFTDFGVAFLTDSFGDEPTDEFVWLYENDNPERFVNAISVGGATLMSLTTSDIKEVVLQGQDYHTEAAQAGTLVIQRIVNDIVGDTTAVAALAHMQTLTDYAELIGLAVVVCTCPPFGNNASHTAGRQTQAEAWNSGVVTQYSSDSNVEVYDLFATLEDPATFNLLAAYDSGDGLHPNATGSQEIATDLETERATLRDQVVSALDTVQPL